jgi:hypothetical protein
MAGQEVFVTNLGCPDRATRKAFNKYDNRHRISADLEKPQFDLDPTPGEKLEKVVFFLCAVMGKLLG